MKMPDRSHFDRVILETKLSLHELHEALRSLSDFSQLETFVKTQVEDFESVSGNLLDLFESSYSSAQYLCPCGSNLPYDRERDEEAACSMCFPNADEVSEYESDLRKEWNEL